MTETNESTTTESDPESFDEESEAKYPDRPSDNPSVSRCIRAWNRAYHKKLDEDESDNEAEEAGKRHYLRAMPPLAGYENVRDFIACVTYALLIEIIRPFEAEHYFAAANVALGALRRETKPARGPGRPRKTPATEENK
jgi:hypothetical protein